MCKMESPITPKNDPKLSFRIKYYNKQFNLPKENSNEHHINNVCFIYIYVHIHIVQQSPH